MNGAHSPAPLGRAVVSCDIVGHGSVDGIAAQREQLMAINAVVAPFLSDASPRPTIWASRGDGGHVVFCTEEWHKPAIALIRALSNWAKACDIGLKIVAHAGYFETFRGADSRWELVGPDINLVGRLIHLAGRGGVLVTDAFRDGLRDVDPSLVFAAPIDVAPKFFRPTKLSPMQLPDLVGSSVPIGGLKKRSVWETLLKAKMSLQMNNGDGDAKDMVRKLESHDFTFDELDSDGKVVETRLNPILSGLGRQQRVELVEASELIQCEPGATLCLEGDAGDTMGIVLAGRLGIYVNSGIANEPLCAKQKGAGDLVGELAYALNRRRSADVRSLGFSAMLAFSPNDLRRRLGKPRHRLPGEIHRLLSGQAARYLCETLDFLPHPTRKEPPLNKPQEPWLELEQRIEITKMFSKGDLIETSDSFFEQGGIYILDLGDLEYAEIGGGTWSGSQLDVIHVTWPGQLVTPPRSYEVTGRTASIRRLDLEPIDSINDGSGGEVLRALKVCLARRAAYHAAITYGGHDASLADGLRVALLTLGYRAYVLKPTLGPFAPAIRQGFTCALSHIVIVTADTSERARREGAHNWVLREVGFRRAIFGDARANILVVSLGEAAHDLIVPGIAPLRFPRDLAMTEVAERLAPYLADLSTGQRLPFARELMSIERLKRMIDR